MRGENRRRRRPCYFGFFCFFLSFSLHFGQLHLFGKELTFWVRAYFYNEDTTFYTSWEYVIGTFVSHTSFLGFPISILQNLYDITVTIMSMKYSPHKSLGTSITRGSPTEAIITHSSEETIPALQKLYRSASFGRPPRLRACEFGAP